MLSKNNIIDKDIQKTKNNIKSMISQLINDKKLDEAKEALDDYIYNVNDDIEAYSMLAVTLYSLGEYDRAEIAIMKGLEFDSLNFDLNYNLAEIYYNKQNYEMALVYYRVSFQNTDDIQMKKIIQNIVGDIFLILKVEKDAQEYLKDNNSFKKKALILCHFNSVYTQEFLKNIQKNIDYDVDIATIDGTYKNLDKNLINNVYCYETIDELKDFLKKINKYEVIHIHFLTPFYGEVAELIRNKCNKLIITIWGSDFLRTSDEQKNMQRRLIKESDILTFDNKTVLDEFSNYFGEDCKSKASICRFGLTALKYINKFRTVGKIKMREELKIPKDAIVVTCGYNANVAHNHLKIIEEINRVKHKFPEDIYFIFPMTYSKDNEYINQVKYQLKRSGIRYEVLDEFMPLEEMSKYTLISDIMIQVQTTDTLSATMQEQMYCGNVVITGAWLPYKPLKDEGAFFLEIKSLNEIGENLAEVANNIFEFKEKCKKNKEIIWKYSSWKNTIEDWEKIYIKNIENKIYTRKKVLVIAYFFPPLGGAGVQRTLKYVKYLRDFGWEPIVITVGKSNYFAKDESLINEIPKDIKIIRIDDFVDEDISIQFLNELVDFYSQVVKDKELINKFIDIINSSSENLNKYIFTPDSQVGWAYKVIRNIENLVELKNIDLIYSTSSPYSDHLIGLFIKQKYWKPWVVDFRDEWTNNPCVIYDVNDIKFLIENNMEEKIVNEADMVVTISGIAAQNYIDTFNIDCRKVKCITNGYDEEDFIDIYRNKEKTDKFRIIHNGLLYGDRNIESVFMAISNLIEKDIIKKDKIEIYLTRAYGDEHVLNLEKKYTLNEIVKTVGYLDHKESLILSSKMNCCLLIIGKGEKKKSVYTGKVFEYLRLGKPILSLAPNDGVVSKLLKETGTGYNCEIDDVNSIENILTDLYSKWQTNDEEIYRCNDGIEKYERKNLTHDLVDIFESQISMLNKKYELKEFDEKVKALFDEENLDNILKKVQDYIDSRSFEIAIKICEYWLQTIDNSYIINYYLGICYNCIKNFEKSIFHHKQALISNINLADIADNKFTYKYKYDEYTTNCIGCGSDEYEIVWVGNQSSMYSNYGIINPLRVWVKCKKCGLVYANPQPSEKSYNLLSEQLSKIETTNGYSDLDQQFEWNVSVANNRLRNIELYYNKKDESRKILDIGAGYGTFVGVAEDRGWSATGLEFAKHNCSYAKDKYDVDLLEKNFYDFESDEKFDAITLFEVIEHLRAPLNDLKQINRILNNEGILVLATPNLTSLYCRKYKENNRFWYMGVHLSFFSREVLVEYLDKAGFEILECNISQEGGGRMEIYCKKIKSM